MAGADKKDNHSNTENDYASLDELELEIDDEISKARDGMQEATTKASSTTTMGRMARSVLNFFANTWKKITSAIGSNDNKGNYTASPAETTDVDGARTEENLYAEINEATMHQQAADNLASSINDERNMDVLELQRAQKRKSDNMIKELKGVIRGRSVKEGSQNEESTGRFSHLYAKVDKQNRPQVTPNRISSDSIQYATLAPDENKHIPGPKRESSTIYTEIAGDVSMLEKGRLVESASTKEPISIYSLAKDPNARSSYNTESKHKNMKESPIYENIGKESPIYENIGVANIKNKTWADKAGSRARSSVPPPLPPKGSWGGKEATRQNKQTDRGIGIN